MRNRRLYPKEWPALAQACKERAGWECEHCGIKHGEERTSERTGRQYRVWLQAAHRDHRQRGRLDAELLCLCFACHARMDYWQAQRLADSRLHSLKHRRLLSRRRSPRSQSRSKQVCLWSM